MRAQSRRGIDIIIADRIGAFFEVSGRGTKIRKLDLPHLPNDAEAYAHFAGRLFNVFRVHDLKSRQEQGALRLFVSFEKFLPEREATELALASIRLSDDDLAPIGNWDILYESTPLSIEKKKAYPGHGGGGAVMLVGDKVYISVGDYNQDRGPNPAAQNASVDFGTIEAIDVKTKEKTRISNGHRNPEGLVLSSQGLIYSTEHGPKGGDELNLIQTGKNYGWPIETYGTDYTSYVWPHVPSNAHGPTFQKPVYSWVPWIGPSQIIEVSHFNPRWDNDFLVASLKAQSLFRLHMEDGRVVYEEPIFLGERIRDLAILEDGTLVLWTDQAHLIYINVDDAVLGRKNRAANVVEDAVLAPCMTCHHVGRTTPNHLAPSLSKVFGRRIASDSFDFYSEALKKKSGDWDADNLYAFITNPAGFAPGTATTYSADEADVYKIIKLLKTVD